MSTSPHLAIPVLARAWVAHSKAGAGFSTNMVVALIVFGLGAAGLHLWPLASPTFHTILDTCVFLTGALIALLLWDVSARTGSSLPMFLSISFAILAIGELTHTLAALEELSGSAEFGLSAVQWRAGTWGPPAHVLVIGAGAALLLRNKPKRLGWTFALALVMLYLVLFVAFQELPRYAPPGLLGITRPTLVALPLLWAIVGYGYWLKSDKSEISLAVALAAVVLMLAHVTMLYSRAPSDTTAMIAHFGKVVGDVLLLLSLIQIGASDTARRLQVEHTLRHLNEELEERVRDRTAQLEETNTGLRTEMASRKRADRKLLSQLQRLHLLDEITRAIGLHQDLPSIFKVVVHSLENQLPVDFAAICTYNAVDNSLHVSNVGVKNHSLACELPEMARIDIDGNGLAEAIHGKLVYEPDIAAVPSTFPQRLAKAGLFALIIAPLRLDEAVFAVIIAARRNSNSFSSNDCEFLRQLSDHVALAIHQARLHSTLQQAYDDLRRTQQSIMQQERLRAIGQMASGIAHDINNAISPVSLYTQSLLESHPPLPEKFRDYLETVNRVINDVAATLARMRDFYREHEQQAIPPQVDLNLLVQQAIDLTRARWNDMPLQRGIVIRTIIDLAPKLSAIHASESEVREALTNLIFNAVDAMPEGGVLTLRTSAVEDGMNAPLVALEISDSGVGMDEETRKRCLEPFFTTKGERGTGLGLAMVYGFAQRHHASIDIDSTVGRGTTIRLCFPQPETAQENAEVPPIEIDRSPLRILLVDDDPFVLDSLRMVLEQDGHNVIATDGGRAGIDVFQRELDGTNPFDVVITDLGMPYVDGKEVARAVKSRSPQTHVILLTGWGQRMRVDPSAPWYVDQTLGKPPQLEELRQALRQVRPT